VFKADSAIPLSVITVFEAVKVTSAITKKSVTVVTSVNVPGPGKITQVATTAKPKKKAKIARVGERKKKKPKTVTRCKVTKIVTVAGNFPLTCKMNKKSRAALRKKSMKLTITTTFTPANGKPTVTVKIVKLKRKR
jgi:hypothetical protein